MRFPPTACRTVIATLALVATTACAQAQANANARERTLDYHADIAIAADGSMGVTEHIRVMAEGDRIRHGIHRNFPTDCHDRLNNH